jgi:hypothetical protein
VCCHVSCGCWGGSATTCHVACWWGPTCQVSMVVGPTWLRWTNGRLPCGTDMLRWLLCVLPFGISLADVDHSQMAMWHKWWYGLWCGPIKFGHLYLPGEVAADMDHWLTATWHKWDPLVRYVGPTWVRWTNEVLTRGTDVLRWPNEMLTRVTLSFFSDSVCVCLGSPVCTQMCLCPQVAPRWTLDWIWALDLSF